MKKLQEVSKPLESSEKEEKDALITLHQYFRGKETESKQKSSKVSI